MSDASDAHSRSGQYSVVPLDECHVEAVVRIIERSRREYGVEQRVESVIETSDRHLTRTYSRARSRYFVALLGETVVGGAGIAALPAHEKEICELQRMYIDRVHRRHGVGRMLLSRCRRAALMLGYRQCYAETIRPMHDAIRFYEFHGFRQLTAPIGDTGHSFNDCWLSLDLGPDAVDAANHQRGAFAR